MEKCILVFAGTTEGRKLTEYLASKEVRVHVCVATGYGESLLPSDDCVTVSHDRLNQEEMEQLMKQMRPFRVIDATHPYAREVTENIENAAKNCNIPYLRLLRKTEDAVDDVIYVENIPEAVDFLENKQGNILVSTGSKEIEQYTKLSGFQERVYARVLSVKESMLKCEELGIRGKHLICMQGPFSTELNEALLRQYAITWMVTKESGEQGGFRQKCEAAKRTGTRLIVIGRPGQENGYSLEEVIRILKKELNILHHKKVYIVGIGPGKRACMTIEAERICREAPVVIGAERMVEAAAGEEQETYISYKPEEIADYLEMHPEYEEAVVVMSGDTGFYSGAENLKKKLESSFIKTVIIPGVSSLAYFCARTGTTWNDASLLSVHGRTANVLTTVRSQKKVFVLTSSARDVRDICKTVTEAGYGHLKVCLGVDLSYDTEQILTGRAEEYQDYDGGNLSVLYIENPKGEEAAVTHGLSDNAFVRGEVPMTKEEVRSVCLSKMRIRKNDVIYDVGAGTGSISIEAAIQASGGQVYAIERKAEAVQLIEHNRKIHKVDNLTVIQGEAPEALQNLPAPDCVFIGGSGGQLEEILDEVTGKNPKVRIVVSAISLETLLKVTEYSHKIEKSEEEVVQITVAKARTMGTHHLMMGQNPVFVISFSSGRKG